MDTTRRLGASYPCARCGAPFILGGPCGKFCKECRERTQRDSNVQLECHECGVHYRVGIPGPEYGNKHRSAMFLVDGMWPAEFAFKMVMERQGIVLDYNGRSGLRFEFGNTFIRPDFHVPGTCTFYEVCSSQSAFNSSKKKYAKFRELFPKITLIAVRPDGTLFL